MKSLSLANRIYQSATPSERVKILQVCNIDPECIDSPKVPLTPDEFRRMIDSERSQGVYLSHRHALEIFEDAELFTICLKEYTAKIAIAPIQSLSLMSDKSALAYKQYLDLCDTTSTVINIKLVELSKDIGLKTRSQFQREIEVLWILGLDHTQYDVSLHLLFIGAKLLDLEHYSRLSLKCSQMSDVNLPLLVGYAAMNTDSRVYDEIVAGLTYDQLQCVGTSVIPKIESQPYSLKKLFAFMQSTDSPNLIDDIDDNQYLAPRRTPSADRIGRLLDQLLNEDESILFKLLLIGVYDPTDLEKKVTRHNVDRNFKIDRLICSHFEVKKYLDKALPTSLVDLSLEYL
jgi:hypothetical protein